MKHVLSFLTEKKEEEYVTVAKEAYGQALLLLSLEKQLNTNDVKTHYLRHLLLETLHQLVSYFQKNKNRITQEGDQKALDDLNLQLNSKTTAPDILQTLKVNLYLIKPGWVSRGFLYQAFSTVLALPMFQSESLWRSEVNRASSLEVDIGRLEKKTEMLSYAEKQNARVSSQNDCNALERAKTVLFASSPKEFVDAEKQAQPQTQQLTTSHTQKNSLSDQTPNVPKRAFVLKLR